ncbi:MAG TPA: MlaD family protein [Tepidisphaeraceae bacterium]|nr:MlaD family protein [Tepidisphaeraceae bacterium]
MKDRNAFLAGLFIVISAGLVVAVIVGIKGFGSLALPHNNYTATFTLKDNVSGLRVGDDVRVGGVKLGTVREIEFKPAKRDSDAMILVRFLLPRYVGLTEQSRVIIESTVTGTSNLNIDNINPTDTILADGGIIKGTPGSLTALLASLGDVGPKVSSALDEYKGLATDVRAKVEPAYQKYANVTDRGGEALSEVRDVFGESKGDFKGTVANLNASTAAVKEKIGPIMDKLDGGLAKMQLSLDSANAALEDIKGVAENTKDITSNVRGILGNNRSRIDGMIASMKSTGDNLKGATSEIRRAPWRLIYKPAGVDQQNQSLFDAARQFAEGANDVDDAAGALRDALKNPAVDAETIQKLVEQLDSSFQKFNKVESQLWEQVKD